MKQKERLNKYCRTMGMVLIIWGMGTVGVVSGQDAEVKQQVDQINIITQHKIEIKGKDLDLKDKIIKIVGPRGATYPLSYNIKTNVFELQKDEIGVGIPYTVQTNFATIPKNYEVITIPCALEVKLTSPQTIEVIFDTAVDLESATKVSNYWIRTNEDKANGIATLGKDEAVNSNNALKDSQVTIKSKDASNKVMVMTFKQEAIPNVKYSLIPCFINKEGSAGYRGGNFVSESRLDFKVK